MTSLVYHAINNKFNKIKDFTDTYSDYQRVLVILKIVKTKDDSNYKILSFHELYNEKAEDIKLIFNEFPEGTHYLLNNVTNNSEKNNFINEINNFIIHNNSFVL